jgi:hypothetical protein
MNNSLDSHRTNLLNLLLALALSVLVAGGVAAAAPRVDESELLTLGFKVLVATTPAQKDWVQRLAPGQIRAMQRNGKKFFIYPDAARNQIYVGGAQEYEAYRQLHPESKLAGQDATKEASEYRSKQDEAMKKRTARDVSDPFYGASWVDLGW